MHADLETYISTYIDNHQCFTSGEVAAWIRENHPEVQFSVGTVGLILRNRFENDELPDGTHQLTQVTRGRFRTPPGVEVFVYGPAGAVEAHEFEVDIPMWDGTGYVYKGGNPNPVAQPQDMTQRKALPDVTVTLRSWVDGRLGLGLKVLEALSARQGKPVGKGTPVYHRMVGDTMVFSLIPGVGDKEATITSSGGLAMAPFCSLAPSGEFAATISREGVLVPSP